MRIRAVVAAGLMVVAIGLAVVLVDSKPRQAGTNYVPEFEQIVTIPGNGFRCLDKQVVPADAAALRLLIGTYGRPAPTLEVSVEGGGRSIASGRLPLGGPEGHVTVPIEPTDKIESDVTVCVEVSEAEKRRRTVLYGAGGQVRLEWLRAGRESWLALLPTVAHRFGLGKPLYGWWVLALAGLLLLAAWLIAVRLALRELTR